ncbi:hypothetical protein SAMN05660923_02960 [Tepidimicrobium xylanilyticum]|uniref:Uncharacterized protein n=2 Tax=Tepidimicrobium xylanilyticum TaxID=1123352 RepID=A0A1H3EPQ4_9FIRM|nr:hypothetical protein SAMN05660923_02960 [Tepidimicrobium xylanilyticum]
MQVLPWQLNPYYSNDIIKLGEYILMIMFYGGDLMFNPQEYAYQIEVTVKAIFKCDKYGLGGIADANFIKRDPFIAIAFILGNFYNKADASFKMKIDDYIGKYYIEMGKSMEEIGEEKVKNLVKDFHEIVSTI